MPSALADGLAGGTVVITGATRAVGGELARHMVGAYGVRHLVLASRRGDRAEGQLSWPPNLPMPVPAWRWWPVTWPIAMRCRVCFDRLSREFPPVRGVIHAAGVLDDGQSHP